MEIYDLTAHELSRLLKAREISAAELTEAVLERVDEVEPAVRAYVTVTREEALAAARRVDEARARGEDLGPLAGIPMAVKDNMCTRTVRTTCSSRILENFIPPYDATVVERLAAAGTVMIGKTNLDEFAMGSSTENSAFFTTRNPWDLERVPGGSSGGSAAAVAAGEAVFSLGSDTGGSIRQPASLCSVVGLKPTYGRVSRFGLVAFASSLDQIGPLTKDVTDCALVMNVISGWDKMDSTSAPVEVPDFTQFLGREVRGLKIGLPREFFAEGIDREVKEIILTAVRVLEGLGAVVEETSLPHSDYSLPVYYILAPAEASSNLARFDGVRYGLRVDAPDLISMYGQTRSRGFGAEVRRRIIIGTYALSSGYYDAYYKKAQQVRTLIKQDFDRAFEKYDVLITPTSPTPAFKIGEKADNPIQMYLSDICTIPVNLAGIPGLSIPCGFTAEGLPVGMQLLGKPFAEGTLLQVAYAYEQSTDHHKKRPPLAGAAGGERHA
ncbi:MAG: aspartyl-tRNA(Asn)/glutamyl-tRNA(Gln) amidotransferase subunit [Bacillota bacterium]|nr:aspartyl-tRNA(Asn)/glutamyl-tRNA(Gln) amidotransferase subunit [Bacillota bacterium]MDK2925247.1 aspartyl-tRNA(Asn)/glutamyl-tRNA(Gln) amidotransferase subunit [Bacillota bacterium]